MSAKPIKFEVSDLCYLGHTKEFYMLCGEEWVKQRDSTVQNYLKIQGALPFARKTEILSDVDEYLQVVCTKQYVHFAGGIAGYAAGGYEMSGKRVLVTQSARPVKPVAGNFSILAQMFQEQLGDEQLPYFYGWLHIALTMFHTQTYRCGQALIVAGPKSCGKTLFQAVITEMFGQRHAKPFQYMSNKTPFNAELLEAEHLVIGDETIGKDYKARAGMGSAIKQVTVERSQRYHPKGGMPIQLTPLQRLTISLNDEPEALQVIPSLIEGVADKIMLLKVQKSKFVTEASIYESDFWAALIEQMPAFVDYMLKWVITPDYQDPDDPRMGIKQYHNPELVDKLDALEPATRLMDIIDDAVLGLTDLIVPFWDGTAYELEKVLTRDDAPSRDAARRLLVHPTNCGTYLGEAQRKHPKRIFRRLVRGKTVWTIMNPDVSPNYFPGERLCDAMGKKENRVSMKQRYAQDNVRASKEALYRNAIPEAMHS